MAGDPQIGAPRDNIPQRPSQWRNPSEELGEFGAGQAEHFDIFGRHERLHGRQLQQQRRQSDDAAGAHSQRLGVATKGDICRSGRGNAALYDHQLGDVLPGRENRLPLREFRRPHLREEIEQRHLLPRHAIHAAADEIGDRRIAPDERMQAAQPRRFCQALAQRLGRDFENLHVGQGREPDAVRRLRLIGMRSIEIAGLQNRAGKPLGGADAESGR